MKKALALFLIYSMLFPVVVFDAFAAKTGPVLQAVNHSESTKEAPRQTNDILQFSSKGLILGFKPDRVYMVGMGYLLTEEFVGAEGVTPVSEDRTQNTEPRGQKTENRQQTTD